MEGRIPSRPAGSLAAPLAEIKPGLPKTRSKNYQLLPPATPAPNTTLAALWRAGFHPGQRCQRQLRWSRWNSTFQKTEPLAEPGTTCICRPPAPRCLLYGGPDSIPASSVSGSSAGRDGTRPSKNTEPQAEPGTTSICRPPAPRGLLYGGPGSIPASGVGGITFSCHAARPPADAIPYRPRSPTANQRTSLQSYCHQSSKLRPTSHQ